MVHSLLYLNNWYVLVDSKLFFVSYFLHWMNCTENSALHCKNVSNFLFLGLDSCILTFKGSSLEPFSVQINEKNFHWFFLEDKPFIGQRINCCKSHVPHTSYLYSASCKSSWELWFRAHGYNSVITWILAHVGNIF